MTRKSGLATAAVHINAENEDKPENETQTFRESM
jgi:hypothetical protein